MPPKMTQPLRPVARYRPGKAPVPVADSDSDDDDNDDQQQQHDADAEGDQDDAEQDLAEFSAPQNRNKQQGSLNVALKQVEVQDGKVRVGGKDESGRTQMESSEGEYETDSEDERAAAPAKPTFRPQSAAAPAAADDESSEYETDSEEEEPLKPLYKPVFVSKRNRDTVTTQKKELDPEAIEAQQAAEAERRRQEAKNLVATSIVRELADKEAQEVHPDVDDTDGLDPEGEFEAWKLRELQRLKRDREERYALEKVREEVEARRALPDELRMKEDTQRADQSRKDKKKGQQAFLQRYHHRGVFHTDSAPIAELLNKRDYTAPTESTVDVSSLPAVMQKRNFGKAHQTKYTHLADQDTSRQSGGFGGAGGSGAGGGPGGASGSGCFLCGGPHLKRDCPQLNDPSSSATGAAASGANASARTSGGDAGYATRGARPPPPPVESGGAPSGGGGGSGRRQGIGYGAERDRERYAPRRSRSPPPPARERRYDPRDERYGGESRSGSGAGRRDRERSRSREREAYRRRSRSPPPAPRRDERDRERYGGGGGRDERDRYGGRGGGGEGRERERDRDRERAERDEKRRRLD
ncbi:hypothetical protein JCM9279_001858 [Rhodotorula babjevae]